LDVSQDRDGWSDSGRAKWGWVSGRGGRDGAETDSGCCGTTAGDLESERWMSGEVDGDRRLCGAAAAV
jgi:hypothetical protein